MNINNYMRPVLYILRITIHKDDILYIEITRNSDR